MSDISGNVEAMSGYTIGSATTDTVTDAEYLIFLGWAQAKVSEDGISSTHTDHATALLVCHYISRKSGGSQISETIGNYSYTRSTTTTSTWLEEYNDLRKTTGTAWVVKVNG